MKTLDTERTIVKTDENGEIKRIRVHPTKECFDSLQATIDELNETIERLQAENEHLKDGHYESDELQKMQKRCEEMSEDYYRGFPISKEEDKKIKEWQQNHIARTHKGIKYSGVSGGDYTYYFTPSSIGTYGVVRCSCGEEFVFRSL